MHLSESICDGIKNKGQDMVVKSCGKPQYSAQAKKD